MGRKSNVSRLPVEVRQHLEKLLREDRFTLTEMLQDLRAAFPALHALPSRSGLHRYQLGFSELAGRMKEIETAAGALVGELGEGIGDKAGALLAHAVTTLATNAALKANEQDDLSIKEVTDLARAARAAMQARTMSLKEREAIEAHARKRMLDEQSKKLDAMGNKGGVTEDTKKAIREALGIF